MGSKPGPHLLIGSLRASALLLGLFVTACGGEEAPAPPTLPALAGPSSILRIPRDGGRALAYAADSLRSLGWRTVGSLPAIEQVLGGDPSERLIYLLGNKGTILGLDLESGTTRTLSEGVLTPVVSPDGSLLGSSRDHHVIRVVARRSAQFRPVLVQAPLRLFGTHNGQAIVISENDSARMTLIGPDRATPAQALPSTQVAAAPWGDLLAVGAKNDAWIYDPQGRAPPQALALGIQPTAFTFSASGHQLYVATPDSRIRVFDRFSLKEQRAIALPGLAKDLRFDFSGRWLLAQPATGDSVWVVDITTKSVAATVQTNWAQDLPQIVGASTLLVRLGEDVAAISLGTSPLTQTGRVSGGAEDFWATIQWVPRGERNRALAAAESALVVQDSGLITATDLPPIPSTNIRVFLQISSSQNPEWANALAQQVSGLGFPASVAQPERPADGYRVIVGPYGSREEAEEAGRRLGRPFFILNRAP